MSQYIELPPGRPAGHGVAQTVAALRAGAVIAYPTDSGYALGCQIGQKAPLKRIQKIRNLDEWHNYTLICRDLSQIALYARVDNPTYRLLKKSTPGGYTFILPATARVPRLMLNKKKKTIGIRVPDHPLPQMLVEALGEPLLSTTLLFPGETLPPIYPEDVTERLNEAVDIIIDGGYCGYAPTTVVDFSDLPPAILREGSGDSSFFT